MKIPKTIFIDSEIWGRFAELSGKGNISQEIEELMKIRLSEGPNNEKKDEGPEIQGQFLLHKGIIEQEITEKGLKKADRDNFLEDYMKREGLIIGSAKEKIAVMINRQLFFNAAWNKEMDSAIKEKEKGQNG